MRAEKTAQWALSGAAWLWVAAVAFAPAFAFPIGHFICHQRPERSFFLNGHQFAVCARCTGLYLGAALAGPIALLFAASLGARHARWMIGLAAIPTLVTWTLEFAGVMPFSNLARCLAGLPLGFAAAWLVLASLAHRSSAIGSRASDTTGAVG